MKKSFKTIYTDSELRQLVREEIRAELKAFANGEVSQVAIGENEGYINVARAADFLKLATGTIYQLVHKKAIPYHKNGKRLLFKKSELEKWIADGNK